MRERALLVGAQLSGERRRAARHRGGVAGAGRGRADDHVRWSPACSSPTTIRSCATGCASCSTARPTSASSPRSTTGPKRSSGRSRTTWTSSILDVTMPRMTGLQAARELASPQARAADPHALDARERAVPVRGAARGRLGLRAQDRRRPRPGQRVPRHHARRDLPLRRRGRRAGARAPGPRRHLAAIRSRRASSRWSSSSPRGTRATRSPACSFISRKTVDRHRANILEKLGMRDRVDLTRYAIRRGLITP